MTCLGLRRGASMIAFEAFRMDGFDLFSVGRGSFKTDDIKWS